MCKLLIVVSDLESKQSRSRIANRILFRPHQLRLYQIKWRKILRIKHLNLGYSNTRSEQYIKNLNDPLLIKIR